MGAERTSLSPMLTQEWYRIIGTLFEGKGNASRIALGSWRSLMISMFSEAPYPPPGTWLRYRLIDGKRLRMTLKTFKLKNIR